MAVERVRKGAQLHHAVCGGSRVTLRSKHGRREVRRRGKDGSAQQRHVRHRPGEFGCQARPGEASRDQERSDSQDREFGRFDQHHHRHDLDEQARSSSEQGSCTGEESGTPHVRRRAQPYPHGVSWVGKQPND